jgi:polyribonucleotide nucleotidyltransferase
LFPDGYKEELLLFSTVMSADNIHNPDVMSINAASAALHISNIPWGGPLGAVRVGLIDGELVINPSMESMEESDLDLVMAGTKNAIMMVEGQAFELPEDKMLEALEFGHEHIKEICACIEKFRQAAGVEKKEHIAPEVNSEVQGKAEELVAARFGDLTATNNKADLYAGMSAIKKDVHAAMLEEYGEDRYAELKGDVSSSYNGALSGQLRKQVIDTKTRIDGRGLSDVRPISIEVGVLPRAHGSVLFTRGETQAIVTTTLGTSRDEQKSEQLWGEDYKRFFLHYNFPAYSVGEVKRVMGPGRREIGHGRLAERACEAILPFDIGAEEEDGSDDFPYAVRVVSEITESNGSSSMASVCGATLSMMDAGVPLQAPVAGVAMGLIKEGDDVRILTDILGTEDHLGDMDFKVCGSYEGITAFQMDIKIDGITSEIMRDAMTQAKEARIHILKKMEEALPSPREEMSKYAPRIHSFKINPDMIRDIIGPGGKVIRDIQRQSGADVNIEDDGTIAVAAVDQEGADMAIQLIKAITAVPEVGEIYDGTVTRIMGFGAFVSIMGGKEGLVHISELAPGHVNDVTDVLNIGDEVEVKVTELDKLGRLNLSKVAADVDKGRVDASEVQQSDRGDRDRGGRGGGGRDRGGRGGGGRDRGGRGGGGRDRR